MLQFTLRNLIQWYFINTILQVYVHLPSVFQRFKYHFLQPYYKKFRCYRLLVALFSRVLVFESFTSSLNKISLYYFCLVNGIINFVCRFHNYFLIFHNTLCFIHSISRSYCNTFWGMFMLSLLFIFFVLNINILIKLIYL